MEYPVEGEKKEYRNLDACSGILFLVNPLMVSNPNGLCCDPIQSTGVVLLSPTHLACGVRDPSPDVLVVP
jgi:hypothetical protein